MTFAVVAEVVQFSDSGSPEHVGRPTFAPPINVGDTPKLVDVQHQSLPSQGRTCAQLELLGGLTAKTDFWVALVTKCCHVDDLHAKVSDSISRWKKA